MAKGHLRRDKSFLNACATIRSLASLFMQISSFWSSVNSTLRQRYDEPSQATALRRSSASRTPKRFEWFLCRYAKYISLLSVDGQRPPPAGPLRAGWGLLVGEGVKLVGGL